MKRAMLSLTVVLLAGFAVYAGNPGADEADQTSVVVAYPVGDLVYTPEQRAALDRVIAEQSGPGQTIPAELMPDMKPLIGLLTSTVALGTWQEGEEVDQNAPGLITPFYFNASLIIRHTPETHEEIVTLLRQIRRLPAFQAN